MESPTKTSLAVPSLLRRAGTLASRVPTGRKSYRRQLCGRHRHRKLSCALTNSPCPANVHVQVGVLVTVLHRGPHRQEGGAPVSCNKSAVPSWISGRMSDSCIPQGLRGQRRKKRVASIRSHTPLVMSSFSEHSCWHVSVAAEGAIKKQRNTVRSFTRCKTSIFASHHLV